MRGYRHDPREIVRRGYDRVAERYAEWSYGAQTDTVRAWYAEFLCTLLPVGARVLDLGCGGGGPASRTLAGRFALVGVDLSARQVALAHVNVPTARLIQADMTRLSFRPSTFDGIAAFYAFTHLPHGELPHLLVQIADWLRPGGLLVASLGARRVEGWVESDWLGAPMYFSGYAPPDNLRFVQRAGLAVVQARIETTLEDHRPVHFQWLVARKAAALARVSCSGA